MNKKVNLYLNGVEFISYLLSLLFMGLYLNTHIIVVRPTLFLLGSICGFTFIGIELFLLLIMNTKFKITYILYMLISIILGVIINISIPYGAFAVITSFALVKDILRVLLVDKIYVTKAYKRYAKIFNIEIEDFKVKFNKTFNKNNKVIIPVKDIVIEKTKSKNKNKGYTQKDLA